ncbi:hypothetical protein GCM10028868_24130 [Virgibacillus kimchii]
MKNPACYGARFSIMQARESQNLLPDKITIIRYYCILRSQTIYGGPVETLGHIPEIIRKTMKLIIIILFFYYMSTEHEPLNTLINNRSCLFSFFKIFLALRYLMLKSHITRLE